MKKLLLFVLMMAPMAMFAQNKFGHFNSADVIQLMPEYNAAQTEVQNVAKQYEDDMKRMQEELQKKAQAYETEKDKLPDNIKARREQEIQDLYQRIDQNYKDNQLALQKLSQEKMQSVQTKLVTAIKEIGTADGYVYIMDISSGIPFINPTLSTDITSKLKSKLGLK